MAFCVRLLRVVVARHPLVRAAVPQVQAQVAAAQEEQADALVVFLLQELVI